MVRILAVALIVLGVIGLAWGGISYTRDRTVVDAGPIEVQAQDRESIPFPPVAGGICLVAGIVLLLYRR